MKFEVPVNLCTASPPAGNDYVAMVLLVDDQAMIGEAVHRAFAGERNLDFHFCSDARQAAALARQIAPTVILQDLVMPGADGLELLREYRDHPATADVPVIVLSTRAEPKSKRDAFAAGANDYLVKLPDKVELIARIRYHSRAYLNQMQRDEAYQALRRSQQQLLEANIELQRLMSMDGLTGLSNRRRFDEYAMIEWGRATRNQVAFSVLIADVDDFKRYNDTYGHLAGDEVLKQVARAIRNSCGRMTDLPARFGGEEFAIILPDTQLGGVKHLAESVRLAVERMQIPHEGSTAAKHITLSIGGAAVVPRPGSSMLELLVQADNALYEAKRLGKNRVVMKES